ncbi:hypothetical protein OH77DRAFT_259887 [Trametes cingulata]|nr:hypothetical protein OH77DRAFT_259887 [Trametes cingulata]
MHARTPVLSGLERMRPSFSLKRMYTAPRARDGAVLVPGDMHGRRCAPFTVPSLARPSVRPARICEFVHLSTSRDHSPTSISHLPSPETHHSTLDIQCLSDYLRGCSPPLIEIQLASTVPPGLSSTSGPPSILRLSTQVRIAHGCLPISFLDARVSSVEEAITTSSDAHAQSGVVFSERERDRARSPAGYLVGPPGDLGILFYCQCTRQFADGMGVST